MDRLAIIGMNPLEGVSHGLDYLMQEVIGCKSESYVYYAINPEGLDLEELKPKQQKEMIFSVMEKVAEDGIKCGAALGEHVAKLIGKTNFKKAVGRVATDEKLPCPFMVTYSMDFVKDNPKMLYILAKDLNKAYELATDTYDDEGSTVWRMVKTLEELNTLIGYIHQTNTCSFDFETVKIDKHLGTFHPEFRATTLSISFQHGSAYVIPLEHFSEPIEKDVMLEMLEILKEQVFENPEIIKVGHNLSFDAHVLRHYGIGLEGRVDDTMLMHHLVDETLPHGLKDLVATYYPQYAGYDDELAGMDWDKIPLGILCKYNAVDSDMTLRIKTVLENELLQDEPSYKIYRNLTMAGWKTLFQMEANGMVVDTDYIEKRRPEVVELRVKILARLNSHPQFAKYLKYKKKQTIIEAIQEKEDKLQAARTKAEDSHQNKMQKLQNEIEELELREPRTNAVEKAIAGRKAKLEIPREPSAFEVTYTKDIQDIKLGNVQVFEDFNFGSPAQLADLLFKNPLGFRFLSLTNSTGKEALEELEDDSGFMEDLLLLRTVEKISGTYMEGLLDKVDKDSIVHTSFLLNGTKSGRLSSKNPNLQNIPNVAKLKNEEAVTIVSYVKTAFVVPRGYTMVQLDYSQAELRGIASFAKEDTMLEAYRDDLDLHILTASAVMKITLEEFLSMSPKDQKAGRSKAKAVNFGLIYGMKAEGFKHYAKRSYGVIMTSEEAVETRDAFFAMYPKLVEYHELYKAKARKFGWVRTLFGRRRRLNNIHSSIPQERSADERVAINSPIQGTAGEFTVFTLALLRHRLDPRVLVVNTVHDSIILYIPDEILDEQLKIASETASNLPTLQYFGKVLEGVSMKVDAEISKTNWKSLEEYQPQK